MRVGVLRDGDSAPPVTIKLVSAEESFTLYWSPDSRRFLINQRRPSGADTLRVFSVKDGRPAPLIALPRAALRTLAAHPGCDQARNSLSGVRWLDATRLAMRGGNGDWPCLALVGDVATGRIIERSVRPFTPPPPTASL